MKIFRPMFLVVVTMLALAALPSIASASVSDSAHRSQAAADYSAMPQTTKRQAIVDELQLRMALIDSSAEPLVLPSGDEFTFQTDIGKNPIDRWQTNYSREDLAAAHGKARISIFDLVRDRTQEFSDQRSVLPQLNVVFRVYGLRGDPGVAAEDLTKMLADIQRAMVTHPVTREEDRTLGGLATNIFPDSDGFQLPKETFEIEFGAVSVNVEHVIGPFDQ